MLAGEISADAVADRVSATLGRQWRWVLPVARRFAAAFRNKVRPRRREVVAFLLRDRGFRRSCARHSAKLAIADRFVGEPAMQPVAAARSWPVPAIASVAELAEWFGIGVGDLEWFADLKGFANGAKTHPQLRHYNCRVLLKKSGGVRLIESPKKRLNELQLQVLTWILDKVPVHSAAHGFVRGRSITTFAAPHAGQRAVLRVDLKEFFPSISGARVQTLFRTMGYPEAVADLLGGICTASVPRDVWGGDVEGLTAAELRAARTAYARPHLPQGAPTSPALANLCAYRVDCRMAGLAEAAGARYTRYADDLVFSGGEAFARCAERFSVQVAAILLEEGFAANHHKTRVMRSGVRQHLAGVVVNRHVNVKRDGFDRLKAILHNCLRHGPQSQNRQGRPAFQAHLLGRVSFVEMVSPLKGARLRRIFEQIKWE